MAAVDAKADVRLSVAREGSKPLVPWKPRLSHTRREAKGLAPWRQGPTWPPQSEASSCSLVAGSAPTVTVSRPCSTESEQRAMSGSDSSLSPVVPAFHHRCLESWLRQPAPSRPTRAATAGSQL